MKKYIFALVLVLSCFNLKAQKWFQYDYPNKVWFGEKEINDMREKNHKQILDYESLREMRDSMLKYRDLYNCSKKCNRYDSTRFYYARAVYFVNQSEWYCAIIYGADSVKSILYYKKGEIAPDIKCGCDPD